MSRSGNVYFKEIYCGTIAEYAEGYSFTYDSAYLNQAQAQAISLTLPLSSQPYLSKVLFPFFDGLIPEGWLLDLAEENWKIVYRDRMGLLLACCKDCIGAIRIVKNEES